MLLLQQDHQQLVAAGVTGCVVEECLQETCSIYRVMYSAVFIY